MAMRQAAYETVVQRNLVTRLDTPYGLHSVPFETLPCHHWSNHTLGRTSLVPPETASP